jgi:hypothetical protein
MYSIPLFWNPIEKNTIKGRSQIRPELKEIEGEKEYEVERILPSEFRTTRRKIRGRYKHFKSLYFLVQWKGYPDNESTWEPGTSLKHILESIEEFNEQNSNIPAITT